MRTPKAVLACLAALTSLACGQHTIAGKFVSTKRGGQMSIAFFKDGSFKADFSERVGTGSGTYKMDGNKLTLRVEDFGGEKATKEDYDHPLVFTLSKDENVLQGAGDLVLRKQ